MVDIGSFDEKCLFVYISFFLSDETLKCLPVFVTCNGFNFNPSSLLKQWLFFCYEESKINSKEQKSNVQVHVDVGKQSIGWTLAPFRVLWMMSPYRLTVYLTFVLTDDYKLLSHCSTMRPYPHQGLTSKGMNK